MKKVTGILMAIVGIALGIVRIVFCEVGVLIAWLGIAIGSVIGLED